MEYKVEKNRVIKAYEDTLEHCKRVAYLSRKIAKAVAPEKAEKAYIAGLWHDLGKLSDGNIIYLITEERPLSKEEKEIIRPHALFSARFYVASYGRNADIEIARAIAKHHELDGMLSRIIHIADFYDALTTRPNYVRGIPPLNKKEALEIIHEKQRELSMPFNPLILVH